MSETTEQPTPDRYDEAILWLTEKPDEIENAWLHPEAHPAGDLFRPVQPDWAKQPVKDLFSIGCAVEILHSNAWCFDENSLAIVRQYRFPEPKNITLTVLPQFAQMWYKLDKYFAGLDPDEDYKKTRLGWQDIKERE